MSTRRLLAAAALAGTALAGAALAAPAGATASPNGLTTARAATAAFNSVGQAQRAGYAEFVDAAGIACIDSPVGAMGIHYVDGTLVGDGTVDATSPEAVIYEPTADGQRRLAAVEYIVFQDAWDSGHASPPSLFGHEFALVPAGNRFGIPAFYELHVWLWKDNPAGMFEDWNPTVTC